MSKTLEEQAAEFSKFEATFGVGSDLLSYRQGLYEGYIYGYKAAQDQVADVSKVMPQWISVKDRLPEDKRRVIYWHDEFGANVGHYDSTFPKQNYHWWSYNFGDSADFRVKWWMPLPEPPKEEK